MVDVEKPFPLAAGGFADTGLVGLGGRQRWRRARVLAIAQAACQACQRQRSQHIQAQPPLRTHWGERPSGIATANFTRALYMRRWKKVQDRVELPGFAGLPGRKPSVAVQSTSTRLALGSMLLCLQPSLAGAARRLRGMPWLRQGRDLKDELAQLVEAILPVAFLIPVALGLNDDLVFGSHAIAVQRAKPRLDVLRHAGIRRERPAQHRLAGDFVHILAAGTARARKGEVQLFGRNLNVVVDVKHGEAIIRWAQGLPSLGFPPKYAKPA